MAILLYVRTRSMRKREAPQPPQKQALNQDVSDQSHSELTGLNMVIESGGREILNRELSGYPIAVGHRLPVGELEGRR